MHTGAKPLDSTFLRFSFAFRRLICTFVPDFEKVGKTSES
jgi:hypothetical protein